MALKKQSLLVLILIITTVTLGTSYQVKAKKYKPPQTGELRRVPDTHPLEYLSALDLRQVGDTEGANERLRLSLERYPYHEPTLREYLRGVLRRQDSQSLLVEVKDHFHRTGSSKIFRSFFSGLRADSPNHQGYRKALRWLDQTRPDPELRKLRVRILVTNRRYDRATELIQDGLEGFPHDRRLALLYAEVLAYRSKCEEAYRRVRQVIKNNPGWGRPYALQYRLLDKINTETARETQARYRGLTGSDSVPNSLFSSIDCGVNSEEISE